MDKKVLKTIGLLCSVLLFSIGRIHGADYEAKSPNIVLILVDDMGPGELSHAGGIIPTPGKPQSNEGWPYRDQATRAQYPQLNP
jgi:hypothetical protein